MLRLKSDEAARGRLVRSSSCVEQSTKQRLAPMRAPQRFRHEGELGLKAVRSDDR